MKTPRPEVMICGILFLLQSPGLFHPEAPAGQKPEVTGAAKAQTHLQTLSYSIQNELGRLADVEFPDAYRPDQTIKFDYRTDSVSEPYHIDIHIIRDEWRVYRLFSIPLLFNRYQNCYLLESRVTVGREGSRIFDDRITIRKKGNPAFQFLYDEAKDPKVVMEHGRRLYYEKAAWRELARRIVDRSIRTIERR